MIAATAPDIDIDQLMTRIRQEVARRKQQLANPMATLSPPVEESSVPSSPGLGELLRQENDEAFVTHAYRALLRREPDPDGLQSCLTSLENGAATQIDILRAICSSEEGRNIKAEVRGLTTPYSLGELLGGNDAEFLAQAYQVLLGREPDESGLQTYLGKLCEHSSFSRVDVLRALRFSEEGRALGVEVAGLLPLLAEAPPIEQPRLEFALEENLWFVSEDTQSNALIDSSNPELEENLEVVEADAKSDILIDSRNPEIDVDQLMAQIRAEAAQLPQMNTLDHLLGGDEMEFLARAYRVLLGREPDEQGRQTYQSRLADGSLTRLDVLCALRFSAEGQAVGIDVVGLSPPPADDVFPALDLKPAYALGELLRYPDELFVRNAYQAILRREPDPQGLHIYLSRLRQGSLSKLDILGALRFSSEGRKNRVVIQGLGAPWLLHVAYRIPLLGSLLALVSILLRPNQIINRLRSLEAQIEREEAQQQGLHRNLETRIRYEQAQQQSLCRLSTDMDQLRMLIEARTNQLGLSFQKLVEARTNQLGLSFQKLVAARMDQLGLGLRDYSTGVAEQFRRCCFELSQFHLELSQLKQLADAKANETDLAVLQSKINYLHQGKADQSLLEVLRVNLRSALESKADSSEISSLQLRLKQAMERIETGADQKAVAELQTRLTDACARLDAAADRQAVAELQGQLRVIAESKAEKSDLTGLTNHLADLMQVKATVEEVATVRAQMQELAMAKADQATLTVLQQALEAKADQATLTVLQQALEAKASAEALRPELADLRRQIQDHQRGLVDQQRRLALLLEEARKRLPEPLDAEQLATFSGEMDHVLDAMYIGFEDDFRGVRAEIKQRLSAYLPLLPTGVGSGFAPAVDLGCGRGEWLELLKDHDLTATGVDLNRVMAESCRERGLAVIEADALTYLREQPEDSLGLITGFHIIEHLPLRTLIALFDEALRVLKPGGMVIFETPNPENLVVGACNFYMDPTHRNPMPPAMTRFLIEARGYVRVEIRRMNQQLLNDPLRLLEPGMPGAAELNPLIQMAKEHYFAAPDYAVVAYKA